MMASEHKNTILKGKAHANPTSKSDEASNTESTRTKRKLSVEAGNSQDRSVKRSEANSTLRDEQTDNLRQPATDQKSIASPNRGTEDILLQTAEDRSNKRQRDEDDVQGISQTTGKRLRLNGNAGLDHVSESCTAEMEELNSPIIGAVTGPDPAPMAEHQELPPELRCLAGQYDFSTMSIISSAKIESRVRNLLERLRKFRFADTKGKPGIVILCAKANVASKLCSVVELAKQQIENEKGKWWQYNKLHGELLKLKQRRIECTGGGGKLSERNEITAGDGVTHHNAFNEREKGPATGQKGKSTDEEEDEIGEEPFEVMTDPKLREGNDIPSQSGNGKKVRNTPIMTIIFAMVPVPGLKELYG